MKILKFFKSSIIKVYQFIKNVFQMCSKQILTTIIDDIVIIDDIFPQELPGGFRNIEISGLLKEINSLNSYALSPMFPDKDSWFYHSYGLSKKQFEKNKIGYLKFYPENGNRLKYLYQNRNYKFKLAYSYFLSITYTLLPFYEKNQIPFVFTLYPGGAFGLNNSGSDTMLKKIFDSKYFRKVIVTQPTTLNYLIDKNLCSKDKIEYLFGGYIQFNKDDLLPKKYYKKDKDSFDICFIAGKYSEKGVDKGYDLFIDTAKTIAKEYPFAKFHIVGGFDIQDIDISDIQDSITFYGFQGPDFLKEFYSKMDICIAPSRPFLLYPGNFDGFPLGGEALSCEVALFTTDALGDNVGEHKYNDDEIVIIKPDADDIIQKVKFYINNLDLLYKLSKNGQNKVFAQTDPNMRIDKVKQILLQECLEDKEQLTKLTV